MSDLQTPADGQFRDAARPGPTDPVVGSAAKRWWTRLLDGRHHWGDILVSPTRHGVTHYRLVVYPPGLDVTSRRLLRAWRAWPTWGAAAWALAHIVLASVLPHDMALAISATAYLGVGAILFIRLGELRTQVRTLTAVRIAGHADAHSTAVFAEWKALTGQLSLADARRDERRDSPVEHELTWWRVYDRLDRSRSDTGPR